MKRFVRLAGTVAAAAGVLSLAVACGGSGNASSATATSGFAAMFEGYSADYDPAASPAELASRSTVVVKGRIIKVVPGLVYSDTADDSSTYQSTILQFQVEQVLAGQAPAGARSIVYVELPAPYGQTAADFDRAAPKHAEALLYLVQLPHPQTWSERVLNPGDGRPHGQPLMAVTTPQGFLLSSGDTETVSVFQHSGEIINAPLDRFLPSQRSFPAVPERDRH